MAVQPRDEHVMDTRTPSPSQGSSASGDGGERAEYKPDLSKEVAMLSTKLINAINYQTNLDDSLQATRHELEQALQELKKTQAEKQSLDDAIAQGVLVKQSEVDASLAAMRAEVAQEREKREAAERAKRQTDGELESLTSSLFEEANKMVAEARKDTEAVERRNSQLRSQLSDTELLLVSQQEQLQDLKVNLESLERSVVAREASMPSTPINANSAAFEAFHQPQQLEPEAAEVPPNHPLYFTQLIQPMLRTDVVAYADFADLLAAARRGTNAPHSRNASGNMAAASASQTNIAAAAATSSPNLPGSFSASSSPSSSSFGTNSKLDQSLIPALKDTKFYKRILGEDLEPTLRLDLAPGLSFLSRRSVLNSLLHGTLVVEPFLPSSNWKFYSPVFPCALCGEARKTELYVRKHRFRTSESEDAQRYPLCDFCLNRVRAAGDFVAFLRLVRDGTWRCASEEDERAAWEEAVRLRERMFWARLGGGVVPVSALGVRGAGGSGSGGQGTPQKERERRGTGGTATQQAQQPRAQQGTDVFASEKRQSRRAGAGGGEKQLPKTPSPPPPQAPTEDRGEVPVHDTRAHDSSDDNGDILIDSHEQEVLDLQARELKRRTMLHIRSGSVASASTILPEQRPEKGLVGSGGDGEALAEGEAHGEGEVDGAIEGKRRSEHRDQLDADEQLLREAQAAQAETPVEPEAETESEGDAGSMVSAEEEIDDAEPETAPAPAQPDEKEEEEEETSRSHARPPSSETPPAVPQHKDPVRAIPKAPAPSPEVRSPQMAQEEYASATNPTPAPAPAAVAVQTPQPPRPSALTTDALTAEPETVPEEEEDEHHTNATTTPRQTVLMRSESRDSAASDVSNSNGYTRTGWGSKARSGSEASTASSSSSAAGAGKEPAQVPRTSSEADVTPRQTQPLVRSESQDSAASAASNGSNGSAKGREWMYKARSGSESSARSLTTPAPAGAEGGGRAKSPASSVLARVRAMEAKGRS